MTDKITNKVIVSPENLDIYRDQAQEAEDMSEDAKAQSLEAINVIEACGGDLEAAANQIMLKILTDNGALARHGGDFDAAMGEFLGGIKV